MVDLHTAVLAELDRLDPHRLTTLGKALRAVVELHAPKPYFEGRTDWLVCPGCDMSGYDAEHPDWPCSTIQAIARELPGTHTDATP